MATSSNAVLREANREVQAADHVLSVVYPLVRDPKVLLGALEHERRAIESATRTVPVTEDAACALARIIGVLDGHAATHTVFTRGGRCVIADCGFASLMEIDHASVERDLGVVKRFVHDAGKRVALGKVQ